MPTLRTVLSIPVLVALLLTPTAPGATSAAGFSDTVLPLLVSEGGAPAAALLAQDRHGTRRAWRYADAGRGIARADHFRAGSVTKTFVATVVLELAAEHRLSLSDTVEQHLPGLLPRLRAGTRHSGEESRITLRDLLTHTSGIADFTDATHGLVPLTPLQAVRLALTLPSGRAGHHAYSSTNYVLLGMVIRQVTGRSYAAETQRKIIAPLSLTGTSFPGSRRSLPSPHGRAYTADGSRVLTFRVNTDAKTDPRLERALLAAEFCPRTW
ncbi:serine hydrolase domain-containing protein [Streptomyces sp. NPDC048410]|uniref:serine hydrolase domain-containing protein n=1 Tax=Streptomyces sp. NPDC048410 TaxID=3365545 RepID=UPI00371F1B03